MTFHTDATIYRADLESGCKVTFDNTIERRVFLYLTSGQISVNNEMLQEKDQARADIEIPKRYSTINALAGSNLLKGRQEKGLWF